MRGFYGLALYEPKFEVNWATVMRVAHNFEVDLVYTIGRRYKGGAGDTVRAMRHTPVIHCPDIVDFYAHLPELTTLVPVEVTAENDLTTFQHPERAIYLFGGEDRTLPEWIIEQYPGVKVPTRNCMNIAVTAGVVCYDRYAKRSGLQDG